ncbi:Cytochrome P450 7B1, partial [Rhizoclosmatium sp. JEL0117]
AAQALITKITNTLLTQVPTLQPGLTPSIFHDKLPGASPITEAVHFAYESLDWTPQARALNDFMLLFVGANSNTIAANYWTLLFILTDKEAAIAVRSELELINYDILDHSSSKYPVLDACISEAIRLRASGQSPRLAEKDCEFTLQKTGQVFSVRKGDTIILDGNRDLMDDTMWECPRNFNYKRFLEKDVRKLPYSPFGGGTSLCPGRMLARTEITVFVAEMMRAFDITLENVTKDSFEPDMTRFAFSFLEPKNDVTFSLKRRAIEHNI